MAERSAPPALPPSGSEASKPGAEPGWAGAMLPSLHGRLVIVTGGTGGIGFETARALCHAGAEVVLAGRNPAKGARAVQAIGQSPLAALVRFEPLDLACLDSVKAFAGRLSSEGRPIDLLINNAGVMALPSRHVTSDGFEWQLGVNFLGHFALTGRLLPLLRRSRTPRVVNLSSVAHRVGVIRLNDLQSENRYDPAGAYAQSKLAVLLFASELQRRSDAEGWGVMSVGAHPGWVPGSNLYANGPGSEGRMGLIWRLSLWVAPVLSHSMAEGTQSVLYAASSPDVRPGGYYGPARCFGFKGPPATLKPARRGLDMATASTLWRIAEKLTGVQYLAHQDSGCLH
jgi:NAD(P)-dependent dehydrogenase (short-subunit alcohol dehydrogenase family)